MKVNYLSWIPFGQEEAALGQRPIRNLPHGYNFLGLDIVHGTGEARICKGLLTPRFHGFLAAQSSSIGTASNIVPMADGIGRPDRSARPFSDW